jgi:exosortase
MQSRGLKLTQSLGSRPVSAAVPRTAVSAKRRDWIVWSAIITALLGLLYGSILKALVLQWWSDPDFGHGFLIPAFSLYVLWRCRSQLLSTEIRPQNFGMVVIILGIFLLFLGSLGAELFTSRLSLLVLGSGLILFLGGWKVLLAVSFPLGFLIFMIPIPAILYNEITFPLQLLASRLASAWLELLQVPVLRDGNVLVMSNFSLEVVEACSGIRSLMALISLAVAYGYLAERRNWVRYALALWMVPSAIITNAIRIVIAGVSAHKFGPAAAEGILHQFSGWLIFLTAIALLLVMHAILRCVRPVGALHA